MDRAADIINRLREFGRKRDFAREKVSVNKPIQLAVDIVKQQFSLQNIIVDLHLKKNLPPILAHNNRMEQVIFNLVTNAREAIHQKKSWSQDRQRSRRHPFF